MPDFRSVGTFRIGERRHWPWAAARRGI